MDLFCSFVRVNLFSDKVTMFLIFIILKYIATLNNSFFYQNNVLLELLFVDAKKDDPSGLQHLARNAKGWS
jgi:hypothetical protein